MNSSPPPQPLSRRIISVCVYIAAAFFFYSIGLIAFASGDFYVAKLVSMGVFFGLGATMLCAGFALRKFRNWRRDLGVVALSSAAMIFLVAFSMFCKSLDPGVRQIYPQFNLDAFTDYATGIGYFVALLLMGAFCLRAQTGSTESGSRPGSRRGSPNS